MGDLTSTGPSPQSPTWAPNVGAGAGPSSAPNTGVRTGPSLVPNALVRLLPPAARFVLRGKAPVMAAAGGVLGLSLSEVACRSSTSEPRPGTGSDDGGSGGGGSGSGSSGSGSSGSGSSGSGSSGSGGNGSGGSGVRAALWLSPDEQLVLAPLAEGDSLLSRLTEALGPLPHSLVDISHRQIALEISGPLAETLLNSGCPLDLHSAEFPVGMCTRTVLGKADIVLWRTGADTFHVEVWRSFAPYVSQFLAEAARELA